jgi:hypothetical protein
MIILSGNTIIGFFEGAQLTGEICMVDSTQYPNFKANFDALKAGDAIPADTDTDHIGEHVIKAIDELSDQDIKTLVRLSQTAKAHLFIHDKNNHVIAMGL